MDNLNVSPDFTIEDIHKIREYNHEATKDMTEDERNEYYKIKAEKVRMQLEARKKERELVTR